MTAQDVVALNRAPVFAISRLLGAARLPLEEEKATQAAIANLLAASGIDYEREVAIIGGVIDFRCGSIGIEVKIGGSKGGIGRQIAEYTKEPSLEHIIVASTVPLSLVASYNGKSLSVVNIARGWL